MHGSIKNGNVAILIKQLKTIEDLSNTSFAET